jgi:hypothetical protein
MTIFTLEKDACNEKRARRPFKCSGTTALEAPLTTFSITFQLDLLLHNFNVSVLQFSMESFPVKPRALQAGTKDI